MKLVDTSVAVDHLRGDMTATQLLRDLIDSEGAIAASEVVRFELVAGARDEEVGALEQFFSAVTWIPVGEYVSRAAGTLARRHRAAYSGIDAADYLIAATAMLYEMDLITTNVRHFPMIEGLQSPY